MEGGFLGTLASIGIPMAISLVSKLFSGRGLQVDKQQSSSTKNVYVPPVQTHGQGHYPYQSPPFFGNWEKPIGMELKKKRTKGKRKGKGLLQGSNSPFNQIPVLGAIL